MDGFIINGGKRLCGRISVDGSKNAALPIIFSCIALCGISEIENLPEIGDVDVALEIIRGFGATVERAGTRAVIDTSYLSYSVPDEALVAKIRASSYLIGACLTRFGRAPIMRFGGCNFQSRPIDMHLYAASCVGAELVGEELVIKKRRGGDIYFDKISVGATVNAILICIGSEQKSRIFGFAREPHVMSLISFLRGGGADISLCDDCITVGGGEMSGSCAKIIPDMIEAGTYIALSLATDSEIDVVGASADHLSSFIAPLADNGADIRIAGDIISVRGRLDSPLDVVTEPYPGFPTDLQPQMAALLALSRGGTVTEGVWKNRFGYLSELSAFGVKYKLSDASARIFPSALGPACVSCPDLRGGAALIISALSAEGKSAVYNIGLVKRGYGNLRNKLRLIGADIEDISN